MEDKAARFTVLIDADKKRAFEALCASRDVTTSQMVRTLITDYLHRHGVQFGAADAEARRPRKPRAA